MQADNKLYDKVIVGGGIAALATAYEILRAADAARKPFKLIVLADKINAPTAAGSNAVLGIDGFEEDPNCVGAAQIKTLVRNSLWHVQDVTRKEKIDCRMDMRYQFLGPDTEVMRDVTDFLRDNFGYHDNEFYPVKIIEDRIGFAGFPEVYETQAIGQINVPELQIGLIAAIKRLGGEVIEGVRYESHGKSGSHVSIHTNKGVFQSEDVPLLATGAAHLEQVGLPVSVLHTIAMHVQLTPEDAQKISRDGRPVAFCDVNITGDVFWGSLDDKGVLTIGFGETQNPAKDRPVMEWALRNRFGELLPDFKTRYDDKITFSFGAMAMTPNKFPLVGRLPDFDVNGGWCSRGIVPSFAAAQALADFYVNSNDRDLRLFEDLNVTGLRSTLDAAHIERPGSSGRQVLPSKDLA